VGVPPCWDVYVWVPLRPPEVLRAFADRYVAADDVAGEELTALLDTGAGADGHTLYLRGREHHFAMITLTDDGATVLGLSIDDPDESPLVREQAGDLMGRLREEFSSPAAIADVEMPPPRSRRHWQDEIPAMRTGTVPVVTR
jgi:hypothetical protein